jgi:hypothetical protein
MRYGEPVPLTRADAEKIFASSDSDAICEALVAVALNDPDWRWTQDRCIEFTHSAEWALRAIAATCLGHLARIHGMLDFAAVKPRLVELMKDSRTRGYAESTAGDIKMFMGLEVGTEE